MRSYTECLPCFVRQAHDAVRQVVGDEAIAHRTLQRVMRVAADFPMERTPPEMAQTIHRIVREESGQADPYAAIKSESTALALRLVNEVRAVIAGAIDPFKMAVRFSIAGNIMDFALTSNWNRLDLDRFVDDARRQPLNEPAVQRFRDAVRHSSTILMLGDNAGETVFDRLLIEQMPHAKVFYAVKGAPVINDATLEDARAAGLDEVAELIGNGSDAPGTLLSDCTPAFRRLFNHAGLVVAKGQANYETLNDAARPLFFLTQVKCPVIARDLGEPVGNWVVRYHAGEGK